MWYDGVTMKHNGSDFLSVRPCHSLSLMRRMELSPVHLVARNDWIDGARPATVCALYYAVFVGVCCIATCASVGPIEALDITRRTFTQLRHTWPKGCLCYDSILCYTTRSTLRVCWVYVSVSLSCVHVGVSMCVSMRTNVTRAARSIHSIAPCVTERSMLGLCMIERCQCCILL